MSAGFVRQSPMSSLSLRFAIASEAKRAPFLADRLVSAANSLAQLPERGRRVGAPSNVRELIVRVLDDRYVLQYRIEHATIVVLRVWHGREAR